MDFLCGSGFWNQSRTWETSKNPDLTWCFEETVLLWIPCGLLLLLTALHVTKLKSHEMFINTYKYRQAALPSNAKLRALPWTLINASSILISATLSLLAGFELVTIFFEYILGLQSDEESVPFYPIQWINPIVKLFTFNYLTFLHMLYRRHSVYSSGPIFIFCLMFALYSAANYRTILLSTFGTGYFYVEFDSVIFVCRTVSSLLSFFLLLLACFSHFNNDKKINPFTVSNFLSRLTFQWCTRIIWKGYKKPLVEQDMPRLDSSNCTKQVLANFQHKLDQIQTSKTINKLQKQANGYEEPEADKLQSNINIATVILRVYWKSFFFTTMLKVVASCMTFVNPVVLDYIISFMSDTTGEPYWHGFFYASLMLISPMIESILNSQYEFWINVLVLKVRVCLTSIIYKKSLRMSNHSRSAYSSGEIATIMSVDATRISDFLVWFNLMISGPLQMAISFYLLWQQVGVASMTGIFFMFILIPFNAWISSRIRRNQIMVMKKKDKRTKLMNEILNGMKVLKLYAWENSFQRMIYGHRDVECQELLKIAYLSGFMFFAFTAAPFLVGLFTFGTFVLLGNVLDPNKAFVSLSLFGILRLPLGMLPMLMTMGAMALVSVSRINKYLNSENLDEKAIKYAPDSECAVRITDANLTWTRNGEATLQDINLEVPHGKLIAVVGSVGSGKSSLLSGMLGDMEKLTGTINIDGKTAYVPQQAWIQNVTLRKNITFAHSYDEKKYKKVLRNCCLEPDINMLPGGDQTEIGERGINLSGGQKQRISLARAVYAEASIYLLDDPLSAVDAHVGKRLFDNVISNKGMLANKTRILATHRATVLPEVDEIIVLKDGRISERGTMSELVNSHGAFAEFITEYLSENYDEENNLIQSDEHPEMLKSLVEKIKPILERSKSRTDSVFSTSTSVRRRKHSSSLSSSQARQKPKMQESSGVISTKLRDEKKDKQDGRLIKEEMAQTGSVKLDVYYKYFKTIGLTLSIMILGGLILSNLFQIGSSLWLSDWSNDGLDPLKALDTSLRDTRLIVYALLGFGDIGSSILSTVVLNVACIQASKILHNEMLDRIMFAPMAFFDTTPLGRILNRFSKDVDVADNSLVFNLRMSAMQFFRTIVIFSMISLEAPIILAILLPILVFYYIIQRIYIATSRQLKRVESITRSPIYHHFNETVNGLSTIRAYGVQDRFVTECNRRIDTNNSCFYASFSASRWLSVRLEFFGYLIVFLAAIFAVLNRESLSPGLAGLAISYSLNITNVMSMFVRSLTDLETNIVSIERLIEYSEVEQEKPYLIEENKPNPKWPQKGEIDFKVYSTRYRDDLELVLKDVSFKIKSEEKVGVVGRTGAGKSSLTLALFRIIEPSTGQIAIDGQDITELGLYDLRSRITIIPQDPVLFTGPLRMNLDPFETYTDEQVWRALELAHLKDFVSSLPSTLNYEVSEGGENLSVGQRQLVCLARALLRKSKILVLDEATAAVDMETDELIQKTIREEFNDCTIVTIAHRLNTVIDYDRILVLDVGQVAEFGSPQQLLEQTDSIFYSMAKVAKLV